MTQPNTAWVTDITHIQPHEGCLYLAVGGIYIPENSLAGQCRCRLTKELVLNALLMAFWRHNPSTTAMIREPYTSHNWSTSLETYGLLGSMSRRGNCHDNAFAESFFQLLKQKRIRRNVYNNRDEARQEYSTTLKCFTTPNDGMISIISYHR